MTFKAHPTNSSSQSQNSLNLKHYKECVEERSLKPEVVH